MPDVVPQVECPAWASILGALGIAFAVGLTGTVIMFVDVQGWGAAYGTAKSAVGIAAMGVMRPELIIRSLLPVIMAGIIALYGLVVGLMMNGVRTALKPEYSLYAGALQLGAGLTVGLSGLAAGYAVGVVGDAGVRGIAQQPRLFIGTVLILIFAEVLGLYGMILSLFINSSASIKTTCIRRHSG